MNTELWQGAFFVLGVLAGVVIGWTAHSDWLREFRSKKSTNCDASRFAYYQHPFGTRRDLPSWEDFCDRGRLHLHGPDGISPWCGSKVAKIEFVYMMAPAEWICPKCLACQSKTPRELVS